MNGPAPAADEQVVVRADDYEVSTRPVGAYLVVRIRGRYRDTLLDDLRNKVFRGRTSLAIDATGLQDAPLAFTRELQFTSELLKGTNHRLVLLNPPERLKSSLSLASGHTPPLPVFLSENQLLGDGPGADAAALHEARELARILDGLRNDKRWQASDREGCWICPFCATLQEEVRLPSSGPVGAQVAEKAYRHLWGKCGNYGPLDPKVRPEAEIQEAVRRSNENKVVVTRRQLTAIETKITHLEDKARRGDELAESVRIASDRQRRLLPAQAPEVRGGKIDLIYRPAEQLSGDFYDFVPLDAGRLGLVIGDVAGHGIEAGILMGMAKKVLVMRLEELGDPVDCVLRANADLFRELDRLSFVTAFVAVYDPADRTLSVARAGHNPPLVFNPIRIPRELLIEPSGTGLGLTKDAAFENALEARTVPLQAGDTLLLYTDGLTEARNVRNEEFGIERVVGAFESMIGSPQEFLLASLASEFDRFSAGHPQEDDVTAVALHLR